jgi:hypothetical protein
MTLADIIIVILVLVLVGIAAVYIRKEKRQGKCIGCPYAKECAAKKTGRGCDSQKI